MHCSQHSRGAAPGMWGLSLLVLPPSQGWAPSPQVPGRKPRQGRGVVPSPIPCRYQHRHGPSTV